jgi:hypothetical protein
MFASTRGRARGILLLAVAAALAASLALPAIASADSAPTSVKLSQSAQFVAPWQIDTQVTLSCTPGYGYWVNVNVVQPQGFGFTEFGGGQAGGQCTGQQQKIAVSVFPFGGFGSWIVGDASASVVACAGPCDNDTKQIHIGL